MTRIEFAPKIIEYYKKLGKNYFRNKNTLRYKNYNKSIDIFWFAQKGNPLPGEQNKIYIIFQQHSAVNTAKNRKIQIRVAFFTILG